LNSQYLGGILLSMLTKVDLNKIRKVVREEVETEVKDSTRTIDNQIRLSRMQVQNEINELDDRMKNVEIRIELVGKDVKDVKKEVGDVKKRTRKIEKTVDLTAQLLDKDIVKTIKRVRRIEEHLGLSTTQ